MLPPQVYASGAPLSGRERQRLAEGAEAWAAMVQAMRPASSAQVAGMSDAERAELRKLLAGKTR